jgi:hypothetical protein
VYYGLGIWLLKIIRSHLRYELIDLGIVAMVGPNDNGMYINCDCDAGENQTQDLKIIS